MRVKTGCVRRCSG